MAVDMNLMVGGEAGQGIQTIGFVLGKTMVRGGLHVFSDQDYESRIRGGHNFFRVRVKDEDVMSQTEKLDILIALDKRTLEIHRDELKEDGHIILDKGALGLGDASPEVAGVTNSAIIDIPLEKLAVETAGNKIMSNSAAVGAVLGLIGYNFDILADVLRWHFAKNTEKIQEDNVKVARAGYDYAAARIPQTFPLNFQANSDGRCMFLTGHEALSLGAMAAGCKLVAAYPMTPTTPILEMLAVKGGLAHAVIQPEDEIAAINMIVGAGFTGCTNRLPLLAAVFALMVEGIDSPE